jgi:hypothetical protein
MARIYRNTGRFEPAWRLYAHTLARRAEVLGPDHPDTLRSNTSLANALLASGRPKNQAALLHRNTLAARERVLGAAHVRTQTSRYRLSQALARLDGAEGIFPTAVSQI